MIIENDPILNLRILQPNITVDGYVNCMDQDHCEGLTVKFKTATNEKYHQTKLDKNGYYRLAPAPASRVIWIFIDVKSGTTWQ